MESSNNSQQRTGHFRITTAISKPRHVFVFIINTANIESQTANLFSLSVYQRPKNIRQMLPWSWKWKWISRYSLHTIQRYVKSLQRCNVIRLRNNDFQGGTLLNRRNFENFFPFVYFDLTKQKMDIKDGVTKLAFRYELSGNTAANYNV